MRFGAIIAAGIFAISGLSAGAAKAALSYTLSSCDSPTCTAPTSTILSFTIDTAITAPPLPTPPQVFSAYAPVVGATAVAGSFSGIETLSYTYLGKIGSYLRIDGLVAANGSTAYSLNGLPTIFSASNASTVELPLTIGLGTYNQLIAQACVTADCSATSGRISFALLTVTDTSVVPEPATWALMLIGFGAAGTAMRRSRQTSAIA